MLLNEHKNTILSCYNLQHSLLAQQGCKWARRNDCTHEEWCYIYRAVECLQTLTYAGVNVCEYDPSHLYQKQWLELIS